MGMSSEAKLIYGYNLGGDEHEWQFAEYDEDEYRFTMPWYDNADDASDFDEQAEQRLLAELASFTEGPWPGNGDGYFDRKRAAEKRLGVELKFYGSHDFSGTALSTHQISVSWGATGPIDFTALNEQAAAEDWDAKLDAAIRALGITPKQERPGWILCSMYG